VELVEEWVQNAAPAVRESGIATGKATHVGFLTKLIQVFYFTPLCY